MAAPNMSIFDGASNITINGGVTSNNTSGHYIDKSRQNVTNHYGSQNVSQTNYVDSNNDYSSNHHYNHSGPQTTVHNINSNNTTQTSYVDSNNDNSNTMYQGDWRGYPQYPQHQGPLQGWSPRGQGQDYTESYPGHPGMTQYDPQAGGYSTGGQFDPSQNWGPDPAGNFQQQDYPATSKPSKSRHRKEKSYPQNHSYVEASEFQQQQHVQHVQTRPASFHAAPAPNTNGYSANHNPYYTTGQYPNPIELRKTRANLRTTSIRARNADFSQHQQYFEQNSIPQTDYLAPSAQQGDWSEPSGSTSGTGSKTKKEKPKDNDRKGKKPQRATVETTDDEDDLPARSKDKERNKKVSDTLGPVLERLDDTDDGFGDLLMAPPRRNIPPASVPPAPVSSVQLQSTSTGGAMSTGSTSQQLRPISTTSQSASGRPAVAATASAPAVANSSITSAAVASASTSSAVRVPEQGQASINTPPPLASTSNAGRVTSSGPTREEEQQAQFAADFSRLSSTLSDGSEKKKKKKGLLSKMNPFGKKKEKGGVVGMENFNLE